MIDKKTYRWFKAMEWFAKYWGCHQMAERSFSFGNYQFPLCARCTGILLGEIIGMILAFFTPSYWQTVFLLIPMAVDGLTQLYGLRASTNFLRLITGLLGGYSIVTFLAFIIKSVIYNFV
jgi:uncharacterized membrane protein